MTSHAAQWPRGRTWADAGLVAGLLGLYALFVARSWLAWGWFDVDYGREMWVPLRLARGEVLYRDVRYPYGPLSPYLHALLYRLWRPHLDAIYASGIVASGLVVLALYAVARQIASQAAAALATALATVDLMFVPGTAASFSYIFPYAFPALHGTLFLLVTLGAALRLIGGGGATAAALCGAAIGLALLTKQEFGVLALVTGGVAGIALVLQAGWRASARRLAILAAVAVSLPILGYGVLTCWVPLATIVGRGLFAPEYFETTHRITLLIAGLPPDVSRWEVIASLLAVWARGGVVYVLVAAFIAAVAFAARGRSRSPLLLVLALAGVTLVSAGWATLVIAFRDRYAALPPLLVLWLGAEVFAGWRQWQRVGRSSAGSAARCLTVGIALALLVRVPARLEPGFYANFYLPPAILLVVWLAADRLPIVLGALGARASAARAAALGIVAVIGVAVAWQRWTVWGERRTELVTPRGTMRVAVNDGFLPAYRDAIEVILQSTPPGATVVAVPCETSLYFLADRGNRLYETGLVAVVNDAAAERAFIGELERDRPALVLVSSRPLLEYGHRRLGEDFGLLVFRWIRQHYAPIRRVGNVNLFITALRPRDAS